MSERAGNPDSAADALGGPGICILTETYHPVVGGGETQARSLAAGFRGRGWETTVVTRRSNRETARHERQSSGDVYRVPPTGPRHLNKWALLWTVFPRLVRLRNRYQVVLVSGFRVLGIPALLASRMLGKVCVLKADSLGEMSGEYFAAGLSKIGLRPSSGAVRLFLRWRNRKLLLAQAFVAISTEVQDELVAAGVSPERIERIPNSVDTERFCPVSEHRREALRLRLGLPPHRPIVVYTGRLVSYKGLPVLLRAWQRIVSQNPDVQLLLVGGGGLDIHNCEAELKAFVHQRGLERNVLFTGDVTNVEEYLQSSDLFVFPSENEAFGISLIEAMACGLPAVATTAGGLADVLRDQETGLAVPTNDEDALHAALGKLLANEDLRARLGGAARRVAVDDYSDRHVVERYAALMERLLKPEHGVEVSS